MRQQLPSISPGYYDGSVHRGIDDINVQLLSAPTADEAAHVVHAFADATFSRVAEPFRFWDDFQLDGYSALLRDDAVVTATAAMAGAAVTPTSLEAVALTFGVEGVSRTCTHQLVRSRVGAGFGQHSMRATPATDFNFRLPASFVDRLDPNELEVYLNSLKHLHRFYNLLLNAGVPFQDARFVLPMGTETHIVAAYNLLALKGVIGRRVCNRMAWEINTVSRHMHDLTVRRLPWVGRSLRARCERTGVCQTLDPMFEASCLYWNVPRGQIEMCEDAPALERAEFSWPAKHNGNVIHWQQVDMNRLTLEANNPDIVVSMVDGETVLAERPIGEWINV